MDKNKLWGYGKESQERSITSLLISRSTIYYVSSRDLEQQIHSANVGGAEKYINITLFHITTTTDNNQTRILFLDARN